MEAYIQLIQNFFTHKDFLPPRDQLPGMLFSPLHLIFAALVAAVIALLCVFLCRREDNREKRLKQVYALIWILAVVLEIIKICWETFSGREVRFEWGGIMPLYPCSIFMYAMPLAIWGKGNVRKAGCGYVCSLGLLGGLINFVYPANVLSNYPCISFAGFHTFFYYGVMVLTAATMLLSGYHSFKGITKFRQLLLPAVPFLAVSVVANLVNFSPIDSDYMFFKLESFFFAPLGAATPDWFSVLLVYGAYLLIHALPLLPSYISNHRQVHA